jgi:hypothetical protein
MPTPEQQGDLFAGHNFAQRRRSDFAGFSWLQLAAGCALILSLFWGAWLTREVARLKTTRIVAVSLSAIVNDFVMTEARSGNTEAQATLDTRHFMAAVQAVLKAHAARGEMIIVGEAVVSSSVPDITADIRAEIGRLIVNRSFRTSPLPPSGQDRPSPVPSQFLPSVFPHEEVGGGHGK